MLHCLCIKNEMIMEDNTKPLLRDKVTKMKEDAELRIEELLKLEQTSIVANDIDMLMHDIETYKKILG